MKEKEYFSKNLKLNLVDGKARYSDRKPWKSVYMGMFFSVLLVAMGVFELLFGKEYKQIETQELMLPENNYDSFLSASFFNYFIIILGVAAFINFLSSFLRYRKIKIENGVVTHTYRRASGPKRTFVEKIANYTGVLLRVQFSQTGVIAQNKYVIELVNKDSDKNIPIYINTNPNNIRSIWIEYAKQLNLNCIETSEEAELTDDNYWEINSVETMEKSLKQKVKEGSVVDDYDVNDDLPETVAFAKKKDKVVLKAQKYSFDIFNMFLSIIAVFVCVLSLLLKLYVVTAVVALVSFLFFAKRDKLVIKKLKLVKVDKYGFFSKKVTEINKIDVKEVSINYSPLTNRYYIAIYSDNNFIIFAKKMPLKDLKWVKKFLINRIVR